MNLSETQFGKKMGSGLIDQINVKITRICYGSTGTGCFEVAYREKGFKMVFMRYGQQR